MSKPLSFFESIAPKAFWDGLDALAIEREVEYRPFGEARSYVRSLGLGSVAGWRTWCTSNRPKDIPADPNRVYGVWVDWFDWLGTWRRKFRPFEEARTFVRNRGFESSTAWRKWASKGERPPDIPHSPDKVYPEWNGWGDWLGTGNVSNAARTWRPFEETRDFARSLGLKSQVEWNAWCKSDQRPHDVPVVPRRVYAAWGGWGDWLGTGRVRNGFRLFTEARDFARSLGLKSQPEWLAWCNSDKRPRDIPRYPNAVYRSEWQSMGDWLGTGRVADQFKRDKLFLPFEEARDFVRSIGLGGQREWQAWCKSREHPAHIPTQPNKVYPEFAGYGDWLNTNNTSGRVRDFLPFDTARTFVRSLGLKSQRDWVRWSASRKRPRNIPSNPQKVYEEWVNWGDWLALENKPGPTRKTK